MSADQQSRPSPPSQGGAIQPPACTGYGALSAQQGRQAGREPYRTDPSDATDDRIRQGGSLAKANPAFPATRQCQDVFWAALFLLVVVGTAVGAVMLTSCLQEHWKNQADDAPDVPRKTPDPTHLASQELQPLLAAGSIGVAASVVAALAFFGLLAAAPTCAVWTALLFKPAVMIAIGSILLVVSPAQTGLAGSVLIGVGLFELVIIFCCLWKHIPFVIMVVDCVSQVVTSNPSMMGVSFLGSVLASAWVCTCMIAAAGAYLMFGDEKDKTEGSNPSAEYGFIFAYTLVFTWGAQVFHNVCHVTYCGVVGRWYHKVDEEAPVSKSLGVAFTTSFGSICFGSFMVAFVRAVEAVARKAARDAEENRNVACSILLCIIRCVLACIGDVLEYFNEWAYIQCAIRGTSFLDSASITMSMLTCANAKYILQDLYIDSVVFFGALFCCLAGAGAGAGAGWALGGGPALAAGAAVGLLSGFTAGYAAASILSSGAKTILALWAEDTEPLARHRPEVHQAFTERIRAGAAA